MNNRFFELITIYSQHILEDVFKTKPITDPSLFDYIISYLDEAQYRIPLLITQNNVSMIDFFYRNGLLFNLIPTLHSAVLDGKIDIVKYAVENGATIVPIVTHRAVRRAKHNREILEYLLKAGADPNTYICNMSGKILIPLEVAVSDNDIKTAQLLVRHGALIDNNYILPLIRSIEMARSLRLQLDRNSILCFLLHHFKDKVWSPILHGQLLSFYIQEGKITLDLDFLSKLLKENQIEMLKYLIIWSVPPIETQVLIELSALAWDSTGLSGLDLIWRNRFLVF